MIYLSKFRFTVLIIVKILPRVNLKLEESTELISGSTKGKRDAFSPGGPLDGNSAFHFHFFVQDIPKPFQRFPRLTYRGRVPRLLKILKNL